VEKNEQRWQSLNPNDGKGGALMLGGGHSATGGSGGKAATCFGVREKHGRGKGRRGCLSGCYEWGGERTGSGTGTVAMWRRREGGVGQRGTLTSKGPRPAVAWARWRQAVVGHAAPSRAERGGVRSGGPHLEERGAHGPRLEHMGWPRRRKELGRA
jgi:hypothetical protein